MGDRVKHGNASHLVIAEARRSVWAVRPEFWDSFARLLALDELPVTLPEASTYKLEAAPMARRATRQPARMAAAVISLQGLITPKPSLLSLLFGGDGGGLAGFRSKLREAVADPDLDAIVLDVDSPGGSTALITETAAEIRAAREVKPILAVANVDAGSAAYWLASQATEFSVTPSGMVGSVGAYVMHVDYSSANEKMGVDPTYVSAGKYKIEGNPDEPLSDEAREHVQAIVDDAYDDFVADVAAGRGVPERVVRQGYGEGRMLTADNALAAGMVDRVETLEGAVGRLLAGELDRSGGRRSLSAERAATFHRDEDEHDEAEPVSRSRKSLADQKLADEALVGSLAKSD